MLTLSSVFDQNLYLFLEESTRNMLFNHASNNTRSISEKLGIRQSTVSVLKNGGRKREGKFHKSFLSGFHLSVLCNLSEIKLDDVQKSIRQIRWGKTGKIMDIAFPIDIRNEKWCRIFAYLAGYSFSPRIIYSCNTSHELGNILANMFNLDFNGWVEIPHVTSHIFKTAGVYDMRIPDWIKEDENFAKSYLFALFKRKCRKRGNKIVFDFVTHRKDDAGNYLRDLRQTLEISDVTTTKTQWKEGKKNVNIRFYIKDMSDKGMKRVLKRNLEKFPSIQKRGIIC
ncbi:MAG: hypothetical protein ACE5K4_07290 [Candidatus Hydrothermarchaeota archaeon]